MDLPHEQARDAPKVDLVYFNAGGGHRAAAWALADAVAAQGRRWEVRRLDLSAMLDPSDHFRRITGIVPEDLYNLRIARGWTLGMRHELRVLQAAIRAAHGLLVRRLARHWAQTEPDLVVSLIPNFNRSLAQSLAMACPGVPFVTVLTDLADLPPHFWIEPGVGQHVVCGTDVAAAQAERAGCASWRVSGMLLRQSFHTAAPVDKRAERARLGLDPDTPTAAVMYGGFGSPEMLQVARCLPHIQLILMCGRNAALAHRLRELASQASPGTSHAPRLAIEFTEDVPRYLASADFFIGKPGPGCLSEALHLGLPVVTFGNAWTMPQERFNVRWVHEQGAGLAVRSPSRLPAAVASLLGALPTFAARARALRSHAAFEVPLVLARLLGESRASDHDPCRRGRQWQAAANEPRLLLGTHLNEQRP